MTQRSASDAAGAPDALQLWLGPLRYVRTERASAWLAFDVKHKRYTAIAGLLFSWTFGLAACVWPFILWDDCSQSMFFVVELACWLGFALLPFIATPRLVARLRRLKGLRADAPVDVFEGPGQPASATRQAGWAHRLNIDLREPTKVVVTRSGAVVGVDDRPETRSVRCTPALVAPPGGDDTLSDAERIELRALAARHAYPRLSAFGLGALLGLLLFGLYTGVADRGLLTAAERHAAWVVPLLCALVSVLIDTFLLRRSARQILADRERDLVREGDALYLAESRILWRHGDIPGPRRQERGGLADPRVRHIARPLLGRPEGF